MNIHGEPLMRHWFEHNGEHPSDAASSTASLRCVAGVGPAIAAAILIECPEIGTLSRKQIASLAGPAPMTGQSGQWRGTAFIQGGRKFLRDALCIPALVAICFNPELEARYDALRKAGKPAKVAITRKLIERANALIRDGRNWAPKTA